MERGLTKDLAGRVKGKGQPGMEADGLKQPPVRETSALKSAATKYTSGPACRLPPAETWEEV